MSITVVIPNYNYSAYLRKCLTSIAGQTRRPERIIVHDDASTDQSREVLRELAGEIDILEYVFHSTNRGVIPVVNSAVESVDSEFLLLFAADDVLGPRFLELSVGALEKYPEAPLCCSIPRFFTNGMESVYGSEDLKVHSSEPRFYPPNAFVDLTFPPHNYWVAGHTTVCRTSAFREGGGYRPELKWHCDWYLLHHLALQRGAVFVPEMLSFLRVAESSYSTGRKDKLAQDQVIRELMKLIDGGDQDVRRRFYASHLLSRNFPDYGLLFEIKSGRADLVELSRQYGELKSEAEGLKAIFHHLSEAAKTANEPPRAV